MTESIKLADFRRKVDLVGKALAGKKPQGLDEHFNKIVFNGSKMYASTHEVGVAVDFPQEILGAVDGKTLQSVLGAFSGEDVTFLQNEDLTLHLECDGAEVDLPMLKLEDVIVLLPEPELGGKNLEVVAADLTLLKRLFTHTVETTSVDDPRQELRCVHLYKEDGLTAYASNAIQLVRATGGVTNVNLAKFLDKQYINAFFCRLFIDSVFVRDTDAATFRVSDSYIQVEQSIDGEQLVLQANLLGKDAIVADFRTPYTETVEQVGEAPRVDTPPVLFATLDHAKILTYEKVQPYVKLEISDKRLTIFSGQRDLRGTMRSGVIKIDHPSVEVEVSPELLCAHLELAPQKMTIIDRRVVFYFEADGFNSTLITVTATK